MVQLIGEYYFSQFLGKPVYDANGRAYCQQFGIWPFAGMAPTRKFWA